MANGALLYASLLKLTLARWTEMRRGSSGFLRALICASSPQVIFEARVSEERQGYIALDDIVLLNYPCCKYPSWLPLA